MSEAEGTRARDLATAMFNGFFRAATPEEVRVIKAALDANDPLFINLKNALFEFAHELDRRARALPPSSPPEPGQSKPSEPQVAAPEEPDAGIKRILARGLVAGEQL